MTSNTPHPLAIRSRYDAGRVLFSPDETAKTAKDAVEQAVRVGADLRGADLYGAYLYGANLRGADLRGAYLRGADLRDANLCRANLYGANLRDANLRGADLRDANLSGAYLSGAYLRGADLRGAFFKGGKDTPEAVAERWLGSATRSDGYEFTLFSSSDWPEIIRAGCRTFTFEQFRAHVAAEYPGTPKAAETLAILAYLETRKTLERWA